MKIKKIFSAIFGYLKNSDTFLLALCLISTVFGIVLISSATRSYGTHSYVIVQTGALCIGLILYFLFSVIDIELIAEKWKLLFFISVLLICLLFPFGVAGDSGNKSWLRFGSIGIQPSEIVKVPFIILLAKLTAYLKEFKDLNAPLSVLLLVGLLGIMFGLIIISSADLGSALVYLFIFVIMMFLAGLKLRWFAAGGAIVAAAAPFLWKYFLSDNQKNRIMAPYVPSIDVDGTGITWQVNQGKIALASGKLTGQGLFHGAQSQSSAIPQKHTDFIFAVCGEELGMIGCSIIIILLLAIIIRCIYVGVKSNDTLGMLVCVGVSAMIAFQAFENIGMCLGLTPVIGLTLPFFSYGGSSIVTLFAAIGLVSGIKMRPKPSGRLMFK